MFFLPLSHSTGSTGVPKLCMLSEKAMNASVQLLASFAEGSMWLFFYDTHAQARIYTTSYCASTRTHVHEQLHKSTSYIHAHIHAHKRMYISHSYP